MSLLMGKQIVVAGGVGRIGWEIVKNIIRQGGTVIAVDQHFSKSVIAEIERDEVIRAMVKLARVDVCSVSEVKDFFRELSDIDGFVNCSYPRGNNYGRDFLEVEVEDFNNTLNLHLGSAFLLTQECVRYFLKVPKWFSLVNFSSVYGMIAPRFEIYWGTPMTTPVEYALMKAGIQQLNKYVSSYVKDSRFRINTIAPGGILDGQPVGFRNRYNGFARGKGMLEVPDVTGSVIFLLCDESRYITGQNIVVDDGFTL
jgi:NAD(P)-dependent dehydrogenase (short-subunit alcohol dehydrogenase family)